MKFGLSLCPEVGRWPDTVAQARLAEELGYDSVWLPEHHLMAGYAPSPLIGLAGLVEVTSTVELGTDVVVAPFYHPVRLAEDVAVLQEMSGGRVVLGAGLGYRETEFAALGVPFRQRGSIFTETLQILRQLWTSTNVSFHGQHFDLDDVTIYPRLPVPPRLLVGGWKTPALARAARYADAWFPGPTADVPTVQAALAQYDDLLSQAGKTRSELPIFREVWVSDSPEHHEAGVRHIRALYESDYKSWGHSNVRADADPATDRFILGHPDQVTEQILALHKRLGVTHLVARLHCHGVREEAVEHSMHLLANQVRPAVRAALRGAAMRA